MTHLASPVSSLDLLDLAPSQCRTYFGVSNFVVAAAAVEPSETEFDTSGNHVGFLSIVVLNSKKKQDKSSS